MWLEGGDHVVNAVADGVVNGVIRPPGITLETLLLLLQSSKVK